MLPPPSDPALAALAALAAAALVAGVRVAFALRLVLAGLRLLLPGLRPLKGRQGAQWPPQWRR